MVDAIRIVEKAIGTVTYDRKEKKISGLAFLRSLFFARDLPGGHRLTDGEVRIVRPGHGMPLENLKEIMGRLITQAVARGTPLILANFA